MIATIVKNEASAPTQRITSNAENCSCRFLDFGLSHFHFPAGGAYDAPPDPLVDWGQDKLPPLSRPSSHVQCPVLYFFWIATLLEV